jgi:hypothetical protein
MSLSSLLQVELLFRLEAENILIKYLIVVLPSVAELEQEDVV